MPIQFDQIPGNIRVPLFHAEFRAGGTPYVSNARLVLIGQMLSTGAETANVPVQVRDGEENYKFGKGSMLAQMCRIARRNAPLQEIWALPIEDLEAGVKATATVTVAGAPLTEPATAALYIGDKRVRVGVLAGDTANAIAANLVSAINALTDLPVTAAAGSSPNQHVVTLTARHKGTLGNHILLSLGNVSEEGRAGRTLFTLVQMANGAGDPEIEDALDGLGDEEFDWIVSPYSDSTNMGFLADIMNDTSGRWSWSKQLYGHYLVPHMGTVGQLTTFGNARNDSHGSVFPCRKFRTSPWETVAGLGALAARRLQTPPTLSRPLQNLAIIGVVGPEDPVDVLTKVDKQTLYYDGIAGYLVRRDGTVAIERLTTLYQTNAWGDADATYLDIETMAQSIYGIRYLRQKVTNTHGNQALADDNPARIEGFATVEDIRNTLIHGYNDLVALGVFEGPQRFAEDVEVERDALDANRVNASLPLDHVNQLRIMAVSAVNHMQRRQPADLLAA